MKTCTEKTDCEEKEQDTVNEKEEAVIVQDIETYDDSNIIICAEGKLFTTSLIVAQVFEKNHKDVLRSIENLECSKEFHERNFAPMFTATKIGNGAIRNDPAFNITRDGFSFLAMGFTGKKAAAWKEKFLDTFNAMEATLSAQSTQHALGDLTISLEALRAAVEAFALPDPEDSLEAQHLKQIKGLIAIWAYVDKIPYDAAEKALCVALGFDTIQKVMQSPCFLRAWTFLCTSLYRMFPNDGQLARPEQVQIIQYMLASASQFPCTQHVDFFSYTAKALNFESLDFSTLSQRNAEKLIFLAWGIWNQAARFHPAFDSAFTLIAQRHAQ